MFNGFKDSMKNLGHKIFESHPKMHDDPAYETPGEYKKIYENDLEIKAEAADTVASKIEHTFEKVNRSGSFADDLLKDSLPVEKGSEEIHSGEKEKVNSEKKEVKFDETAQAPKQEPQGLLDLIADEVKEDAKYLQKKAGDAAGSVISTIECSFEHVNQSRHDAAKLLRSSSHEAMAKACETIEDVKKACEETDEANKKPKEKTEEENANRVEFSEIEAKKFEKSQNTQM